MHDLDRKILCALGIADDAVLTVRIKFSDDERRFASALDRKIAEIDRCHLAKEESNALIAKSVNSAKKETD